MNIKELQISNILSFKYYENVSDAPKINFEHGLNIFIGENGSGKSTALEVLNFVFKRVLFTQITFNQDHYFKRETLSGPERKVTVANPGQGKLNAFRLDPTWGTENKEQKIRVVIQLDEIDQKNIEHLKKHQESLAKIATTYSEIAFTNVADQVDLSAFTIDITLNKTANTYTHQVSPATSSASFQYLSNYNFFKELIRLHNFENPDKPIDQLFESFALIGSFRNYSTFTTNVSLKDKSGAQQIQAIYDKDFSTSMNSSDDKEPAIFNLVRLQIADKHFEMFGTSKDKKQCEDEVNATRFLKSINKKLKLVNLECNIRLSDQRTWQYRFEFTDVKRRKVLADINSLSAGQKAIVHLVFEAYGRGDLKGGLVVIDEPEIHLHYQFQHEYLRVIQELNKEQKCQYVLVTHSESLINSATIHSVKRFSLNADNHTQIMSPSLSTEQRLLIKILDNTRATYAFFGKKVVLVEGDTDRYFFKAALTELNPSLSQEISILDIGGKGGFESWKAFFQSFGLRVYFIGDFDNVYSLKIADRSIVTPEERNQIENELKQEKLNNLNDGQKVELKNKFDALKADGDAVTSPKRELWKPVLDTFISFSRIERNVFVEKVRANKTNIDTDIETLYGSDVFILKTGDLEKYLGLSEKGLPGVIKFCNEHLSEFIGSDSVVATEVKGILQRIVA